jgi:uncharacterized protein
VAVAPRSYWKSTQHSPTQKGILKDYLQVLKYTQSRFSDARIIVYGHSLGGAVSVCLLSQLYDEVDCTVNEDAKYKDAKFANIRGLIVENPFSSIPGMVKALYRDKWTPYHHMGPLALDKWDALSAMRKAQGKGSVLDRLRKDMMIVVSEMDEVVPAEMGKELWEASRGGVDVSNDAKGSNSDGFGSKVVIQNALHDDAWQHRQWLKEMTRYIAEVRRRA